MSPMWRSSQSGPLSRLEASIRKPGGSREHVAAKVEPKRDSRARQPAGLSRAVPITHEVVQ